MTVHASDLDDTLFKTGGWENDHFRNATPINEAIAEVLALLKEGHEVHIVCGRHGQSLYDLTLEQVQQHIPGIPVEHIHTIREHEEFQGNEFLSAWKAQKLRDIKAKTFRGDTVTDLRAAELAGCAFTFVGQLKGGERSAV